MRFHFQHLQFYAAHLHSALEPFMPDVLVGVECIFSWYWVADFCEDHHLPFALGHALYMKAIHGGKTKNDKIDSHKIALKLRSGMFPSAYVYPRNMRAARNLLRRRQYFVHQQSELLAHIQITNMQYNLPDFQKNISYSANRTRLSDRFPDPDVQKSVDAELSTTTRSPVSSYAPYPVSAPSSLW